MKKDFTNSYKFFFPKTTFLFLIIFICAVKNLWAENSITLFSGYQTSPHSDILGYENINNSGQQNSFNFNAGWLGRSLSMPPYYGLRWTKWNQNVGWEIEFNHTKVYADTETLNKSGFEILQFTDGLNNITLNRTNKFEPKNIFLKEHIKYSYISYGLGVIIPHVEVKASEISDLSYGYQFGGPTLGLNFGFVMPYNKHFDFVSEYRCTASWLDVDLKNDGKLKSRIFTNALNLGVRYNY